ncbi:MAG: trypsin-like peptidase domain-containing protein [Planctomycetes bacterium]|nr:trypsin-like peptidase domain-containing protein [Planctomycetota bacterium]
MGRVHGPGARLRIVTLLVLGLLGGSSTALAQRAPAPIDRDAWLSRLGQALREDRPDEAFDRFLQDWHKGPGAGLAGEVRGAGRRPADAPLGKDFWDVLGHDALGQVDGALHEALGRWADAPNGDNLGRVEALERVRDRMHGVGAPADGPIAEGAPRAEGPHGREVRDAEGRVIGWDRDGDGVADLFDRDGDGVPDHFTGGSNAAAAYAATPTTGDTGAVTRRMAGSVRTVTTTTTRVRTGGAPGAGAGGLRGTTGREPAPAAPVRADLPTLDRVEGHLREALEAAGRLEGALERSTSRVAAAERVRDRLAAASEVARGLEAEARRAPAAAHPHVATRLTAGLNVAVDVENQLNRCLSLCAGRGGLEQVTSILGEAGTGPFYDVVLAIWNACKVVGAVDPDAVAPPRGGAAEEGAGTGTGFLVGDGRHLITNAHVVGNAQVVEVEHAGRTVSGQVVARDPALDLALIRVGASLGEPLRFAPAARRPGVVVFAYGFGVLSARGDDASRCLTTRGSVAYLEDGLILFDAHVNPGNSGGPLVDARGCFVGVVVAKTIADSARGIDSVSIAVDGEVAVRWLSSHGVHATHEPGPPRGDLPPDPEVRQAVARIVKR